MAAYAGLQAPLATTGEPAGEPTGEPTGERGLGASDPPTTNTQVDRAMAAYARGTQNYNLAQYEAALADFKEAASLYASPDFQYNIALCYEKLGKYDEAIRAFATYLKVKPDAEDRPNVENRIRELQRDIERDRREAETTAAMANNTDPSDPSTPSTPSDPAPADPADAPSPTGNEGRGMVIAGTTFVAVGTAVALGGGIGFGVVANDQRIFIDEIQTGGNPQERTFAEAQAIEADGKRFEAIQVAMAATGSVLAVAGAVLLTVGLRKRNTAQAERSTRASAWVGSGHTAGLMLTGRF